MLLTFAVGFEYRLIDLGRFGLEPGEQRRAEIKTDFRIIVDEPDDLIIAVEDARNRIRRIAFGGDPLVPIVIRVSGILKLDGFEPWVLPWRLVEMSVNANVSLHLNLSLTEQARRPRAWRTIQLGAAAAAKSFEQVLSWARLSLDQSRGARNWPVVTQLVLRSPRPMTTIPLS